MTILNMTHNFEKIFLLTIQDVNNYLDVINKEVLGVYKPTVEVPYLTNEQIGQALATIPQ